MPNTPEHSAARRQRHTNWMIVQKDRPCEDCGGRFPHYVMDWHHRDPSTKVLSIGQSMMRSLTTLAAEIEKCDLLCANCHRIREYSNP